MSHANTLKHTLKHLAALLLAGAALVGCGGDAEPPPPPVGSPPAGPDTTAPTVTIANNVAAAAATGPVAFTFVFSEDVGVSFEAADITVTGGTAGAFTRVDGRQATLVVTPTVGVAGTINVSVAAGRFSDIAGNANTASASASKDYVVPPPPPTSGTVLANFDTISPPVAGFEGGEGSAVEPGPAGGSGNALKVLRSGGQVFALAIVSLPSTIPLEAGRLTISARVYSPTAGIPMVLKLEGTGGSPSSGDLQANQAVVVGWQTLTWTVPAVNTNYRTLVLLPNLGTVDAPPGKAYYFDDIQLLGASSGGGGGAATTLANFDSVSPPFAGFEGAEGSAVEAGPAGGSGNALKVLRSGGQVFALAVVTLPSNIPLATGRLTISARVHSPTAGIPMVLKLEGPAGNPSSGDLQANQAVVVGWQTLTWTVPAVNTNYNRLVLLPNLGAIDAPPGKAYYFDDIQLLGASSGGGGGGPLTFSSGFAGGNRTVQGGEFGGFSGSNQDAFNCTGGPAWCGGGGDFSPGVAADASGFFYYYQTPTPATDLYMGIYVLAAGITGGLSNTADNTGVQISGQTSIKFKLGQNPEWFGTATNKFAVDLTLGKRYVVGGNTCRVQLRTIVTPTAAAASNYTVPLSAFSVVQDCAQSGLTVAAALTASPISQVSFQGAAGGAALSAGGQTTGANRTVAVGGVYPTTLVLNGGITFE